MRTEEKTVYVKIVSGIFEGYRGYLTGKVGVNGKLQVGLHSGQGGEPITRYLDKNEVEPIKKKKKKKKKW